MEEKKRWVEKPKKTIELPSATKVTVIACIAMLVISGLFVGLHMHEHSVSAATYKLQKASIEKLNKQVDALNSDKSKSEKDLGKYTHSAMNAGNAVAKAQSNYSSLNPDTQSNAFATNAASMDAYLSDKSFEKPWYGPVSSSTGSYTWTFLSTYSFAESSASVVWLCTPSAGSDVVLAYATATYDADSNAFKDISVVQTAYGKSQINQDEKASYDASISKAFGQ